MILVLGSVVARKECYPQALALSREHVERSRSERGCISHAVHQDVDNPLRLVFVEQWSDQASLAEHFRLSASREFVKSLRELAMAAPTIEILEASSISRLA